ncbi:FHA domain-containing protein [Shinella sumterensis]|uniref:FHA domain-containing protein n=1 Tax=Shinella sumterensis TaxID=1967501 RepID=UPI003F82DC0E
MTLTFNAIHRTGQENFVGKKALAGEAFLIGRGPDNDWILDDEDCVVSKRHCVIEDSGGAYVLRDTSTNGVFLNGVIVGRDNCRSLADGDCIEIGPFAFRIEIEGDGPLAEDGTATTGTMDITTPAIPFSGTGKTEVTGSGLKSLLDDIAAHGGTASGILPGSNDTSLPRGGADDQQRKVNRIGWDEPPAIRPVSETGRDIEAAAEIALEKALLSGSLPQREDTPGLNTVVQLSAAASVLPSDWNALEPESHQDLAVEQASGAAIDLVRTFARAANLPEPEVLRLTAEIEAGRMTADDFFAHAGGLFRQCAVTIEERLSTCRSKIQSLEYTMPAKAIEHVQAAIERIPAGDRPASIVRDLLSAVPALGANGSILDDTVKHMRTLDAALFTTLLSVSALSFGPHEPAEDDALPLARKAG